MEGAKLAAKPQNQSMKESSWDVGMLSGTGCESPLMVAGLRLHTGSTILN